MKFDALLFNTYLCAGIVAGLLLAGCRAVDDPKNTGNRKKGKEAALLMLHVETPPDGTPYTRAIHVPRGAKEPITVEVKPFLDNGNLLEASLVEADKFGGIAIRLQFDHHGVFALDTYTSANRGRHIAIRCQFWEDRWLAAPVVARRISDGVLQFTPDLTREEAEYVVTGLNNVARRLKKRGAL